MKTQITSRIVNVKRFIVKNKNGEYLKSINGEITNDIFNAYQFKSKARARYFSRFFKFGTICTCSVDQLREKKEITLEIGDTLNNFMKETVGYRFGYFNN